MTNYQNSMYVIWLFDYNKLRKAFLLLLWQEVSNMWQSFSKCWGLDQHYYSLWSLRKTLENMSIWKREYMPIRMSEQSCFIIIALLYSSILHGFRRQREAYLARCEERTSVIHDRHQLTDHTPWPVHQSPLWTSNNYIVWPQTPLSIPTADKWSTNIIHLTWSPQQTTIISSKFNNTINKHWEINKGIKNSTCPISPWQVEIFKPKKQFYCFHYTQ